MIIVVEVLIDQDNGRHCVPVCACHSLLIQRNLTPITVKIPKHSSWMMRPNLKMFSPAFTAFAASCGDLFPETDEARTIRPKSWTRKVLISNPTKMAVIWYGGTQSVRLFSNGGGVVKKTSLLWTI